MAILEVQALRKQHKLGGHAVDALTSVDFMVEEGEFILYSYQDPADRNIVGRNVVSKSQTQRSSDQPQQAANDV